MGALKNSGYKTEVQGFGVVEYGENQIDSSLNYLNSMEEVAAFLCLPRVLKRGIRTRGHENHKGRSFDTVTFAAPVEINGVRGNMAVVVKQIKRNLYKTHRILMPDGSAFSYDNKKTEPTPAVGTPPMREAQETRINSANISIPPSEEYVNPGVQNSLRDQTDTEEFKRWFGNSQVVNEDGTPKVMYHGTATEFWTFEKRKANDALGRRMGLGAGKGKFYLSEYEGVGRAAANSAASLGKGKTPRVMELYVSAQKVMDRVEYDRRLEEAYDKYPGSRPNSAGYDYKARDKAIAEVDKAIRKEGYDGVWDRDSGEMFVYEPTQIKSATDNVGSFDPENPDIRYSLRELPSETTVREFLSEAGDDAASTVQEKSALQIYRKKLDEYKAATKAVEAAEAEWSNAVTAKGGESSEAIAKQNTVNIRRSQQRRAYEKLVDIEETPYVKQVFDWTRQFITESLSGSAEEITQRQAEAEANLAELEAQYEELRTAGRTQLASEKKRELELKQRYVRTIKSEVAEGIKERRAEYDLREARSRKYRHTRNEVNKLRRRISRKVKRLNTLRVRETDQKHVPQELQHVADEVMRTFTEGSLSRLAFSAEKTASLRRTYAIMEDMESNETYFVDDETKKKLDNLVKLSEQYTAMREKEEGVPNYFSLEGVELQNEILKEVDEIVSHVLKLVDDANKEFLKTRTDTFNEFAKKTGEKLLAHDDHKVRKGWMGKAQEMLDELLVKGNTTPIYFFEHLQNEELLDVFNELRQGQNLYAQIVAEGKDFVQAAKAKHNYGAWVNDGKLTMKTRQGHMIELTREEAAEIYAIAKREQANKLYQTEHLKLGGFQYKNIQDKVSEDGKTQQKNTPHQLDAADIDKISKWLTAEQKAYADELVGFLSTTMADYGNQASMDMFGYRKFTEQYYIPFHTVANQRFQKGDEGPQGENAGTGRVKNSGFTKKVQHGANATLSVQGITDTVADHIHKMAAYSAMVQPIENMKRLLNHKVLETDGTVNTVRALIGQKYGQASEDYLTQLLKDANGATMSDQRASKVTDKLVGAFKRGAVMASASVVLQQPTAAARAMAYISPKYFKQNPFYKPSKGTWDEMMKYSGTAVIKDMGKFDVGMGLTATQYISDENLSVAEAYRRLKAESKTKAGKAAYDRFMAWLTAAPGKADQWTWGLIWKAVKAEQAALHPEMDQKSEAFLNMCGARFDDVIDHTQVYDSVLTRSNLMRSTNALHKMATSFMSEPTLSLNMLYDALTGKHSGKQRGAIIGSVVASQVLAGALAALVQAWNDDDDERNWLEKYADRATGNILDNLNPLGMIPYVSDIISIFEGYDVERPDMSVITDIISYTKTFFDKATDPDKALGWKDYENFVGTLANLLGIPAKNISREMRRTWNMVTKTEWSAPSAFGVGHAMLENTFWYGGEKKDYYQRIATALARGDTELAEDYKAYMLASKAVDENALTQGIRTAYKEAYERGGIDKEQAIDFLQENNLVTGETEDKRKQSAFQYVDKWGEGTTNYSAYNTLKDAYKAISFSDIEKAWKELTNNGYSDEQVKNQSRTLLKQLVQDGTLTTGQATQLLRKWCPYKKDSDNTDKPKEWVKDKK